jgi:hypothetical protein
MIFPPQTIDGDALMEFMNLDDLDLNRRHQCPWGRTEEQERCRPVHSSCTIISKSNGEVYREEQRHMHGPSTAPHYTQGPAYSAVGTELGTAHRSSANDGYAGALYIPLSHYTGTRNTLASYTTPLAIYLDTI